MGNSEICDKLSLLTQQLTRHNTLLFLMIIEKQYVCIENSLTKGKESHIISTR